MYNFILRYRGKITPILDCKQEAKGASTNTDFPGKENQVRWLAMQSK